MVTILKIYFSRQKNFTSIRWKLIAMYLLMLTAFVIIMNMVVSSVVLDIYIRERKENFNDRLKAVSSNIRYYMEADDISFYSENISSVLYIYAMETGSELIAIDKENNIVGNSDRLTVGGGLDSRLVENALRGRVEYEIISTAGSKSMNLGHPIVSGEEVIGAIYANTPIEDIYESIEVVNKSLIAVSFIGILLMLFIKFIFVGYVFKPLNEFLDAIMKISEGDLDHRIKINTNDEFKKLADTFNSMTYKLKEADSQRKAFVAYVSHELKTPLSTIKLLSETLVHQDEIDMEVCREFLKDISSESDRLTNIVNDLLTMMELDIYQIEIDIENANMNAIIQKVYSGMKPLANEKSIELDLIMEEELDFRFDADRIKQTLINIISNAIKYTDEGGMITLRMYRIMNKVNIEVRDTGIGIPKESIAHVFDRFYRVDKARARATGGSGLGLSIAKQIIELHGGLIRVESQVGEGTVFTIELPYETN